MLTFGHQKKPQLKDRVPCPNGVMCLIGIRIKNLTYHNEIETDGRPSSFAQ